MKKKYKDFFRKTATYLFCFAAVYFLSNYFYSNWDEICNLQYELDYVNLIISFFFLYVVYGLKYFGWFIILKDLSADEINFQHIVKRSMAEMGKYIPGKIWGYAFLHQQPEFKNSKTAVLVSFLYESLISIVGVVVFSSVVLIFNRSSLLSFVEFSSGYIFIFVAIMLFLFFFGDRLITVAVNYFFKEQQVHKISKNNYIIIILLHAISWLFFTMAFYFLIFGISNNYNDLTIDSFFNYSVVFANSSIVGFLAFFAPGGLGVRESLLLLYIEADLGRSFALILVLLSRFWLIFAEISLALLLFVGNKIKKSYFFSKTRK